MWVLTEPDAIGSHFLLYNVSSEMIMLKDQLFTFALQALAKVHETKEQVRKSLKSEVMQNYVTGLKEALIHVVEERLHHYKKDTNDKSKKTTRAHKEKVAKAEKKKTPQKKKTRKSSIRPAKEIKSDRAEEILSLINKQDQQNPLDDKKSLDCLIWALGQAARAQFSDGMSVHDVSALLYRAYNINLYPINISRVLHSNENLIQKASPDSNIKTYILTDAGMQVFNEKFATI